MPERRPQQQRGHERRQTVVEGAARMFDRVGYGQASLSDIAREAGTTQGSLYFYFPSKEELALAVINEQSQRSIAALTAPTTATSPFGALVQASRMITELLLTDPIARAGLRLSLEQGVIQAPTSDFHEQWIANVEQQVQASIDLGELRSSMEPADLARSFVAFFTGTQLISSMLTGRSDLLNAVDAMWRLLITAVIVVDRQPEVLAVLDAAFDPQATEA
ncbi:ScbR family autoregulator-binding transcription factor [Plantibacter sp. LMC-P-059a]|jgi:AcrR family transcriptional regulator|uniref:ScbR family autoregulator-binding transcription factor n=1 Tax=Plantibacter sp. LMC-P-059a TaxID=3040297 RepID=UPI00254F6004|nr:ScbR family autoregulator-binding transcription factor [Plantibacter sp. LMC-P-059a]